MSDKHPKDKSPSSPPRGNPTPNHRRDGTKDSGNTRHTDSVKPPRPTSR